MRTGSRILVVVGMVFWAVTGLAQADYAFKVLANKGANEYKSGDTWQPIKTGISLNVGDEVKVSENAYLGLVSSKGKPMELKKPSNYKVADLLSQLGTGTSVMAKYTDFILSSNSAEAKKNRMVATGAVHRGTKGTLAVFLPSETKHSAFYNNTLYVLWKAPAVGGPYVVTVMDFTEEELLKADAQETSVKLDLSDKKFAGISNLLIRVSSKADSKVVSENISLKRLTAAEIEKIKKAYDEVAADFKDDTALNKYLLGGFYEQHGLYVDALTCYEEAVRMAPDTETFAENKADFLIRSGIYIEKE